jgi:hypothetical protein
MKSWKALASVMSLAAGLAISSPLICTEVANAAQQAPAPSANTKPRTAKSMECSKQADAKGLHGKERRTFRAQCKKT